MNSSNPPEGHHKVLIVGGGSAGLTLAGGTSSYDGYRSCPLVTSRNKLLLAEFNYDLERTPSLPFIETLKPRRDLYLLKGRA